MHRQKSELLFSNFVEIFIYKIYLYLYTKRRVDELTKIKSTANKMSKNIDCKGIPYI